jgi:hypothetical protein
VEENNDSTLLLEDNGYFQNVFKKPFGTQQITVSLYKTHLKIMDTNSGELIEDAPIDQIKKVSKYFSSRIIYTLYGLLIRNVFFIETQKKKYKISWANVNKESYVMGRGGAALVADQQNYSKNQQWSKAIKDLQK